MWGRVVVEYFGPRDLVLDDASVSGDTDQSSADLANVKKEANTLTFFSIYLLLSYSCTFYFFFTFYFSKIVPFLLLLTFFFPKNVLLCVFDFVCSVRDQVYNACLRDILVRSDSCHLLRHLYMVVAHRHARTSCNSAERLNPCLSGKDLFHMSMFLVTCACSYLCYCTGTCSCSCTCTCSFTCIFSLFVCFSFCSFSFCGSQTALHHKNTTNQRDHVHNTTQTATTHARAGALMFPSSCLDGGITRVGPGQHPQYTRASLAREAVGGSQHDHHRAPQVQQPTSPTLCTR